MAVKRFYKDHKYYNIYRQKTLFADKTSIICSWGSNNSNRGGHKIFLCESSAEYEETLERIIKRRLYRGYIEDKSS